MKSVANRRKIINALNRGRNETEICGEKYQLEAIYVHKKKFRWYISLL